MPWSIAHLAVTLAVCVPVGGRLLRSNTVTAAPSHTAVTVGEEFKKLIEKPFAHPIDDLKKIGKERKEALRAQKEEDLKHLQQGGKSTCPRECACYTGDGSTGGSYLISGMCLDHCSEELKGYRYCGTGSDYTTGNSIDCRRCKDPEHFGATYKVHQAEAGTPERSIIMMGPWNGSEGWMFNWTIKYSEEMDPTIRQKYRVLDVAPKKFPGTDFHAWYGYANEDDWFKDKPIQQEVDLAVAYVHHLIEQEYKVVGDYKRIILGGLSQGASLALEAAIRFPHELGLVLSQRGVVSKHRREGAAHTVKKTPYLMFMGEEDHYYGVTLAKKSCRFLENAGNPVFLKTIKGLDHDSDEGDGRVEEWRTTVKCLAAVLSQDPASTAQAVTKVADWTACG